ncbi:MULTISPECIES: sensor histidine kinase [Methylobacterium]|uniref:sensor histidine kinase n=2 Tax=Methylobacteriaceae TaxID=119045 RepID=UPI0005BB86C9|nr:MULTISPECIES: HWE histidine kinase domain-containing protein [unclassified Methylobacterium]MDE4910910.1 HWE histidine kinase domain-containing protein [Methylobacterium sp. 092160098-2]MDH3031793.1 HWE histidine kinase domain-containing protein [Methylobacterium fujisawaense]
MNERVGQDPAAADPSRTGFDDAAIGLVVLSADEATIAAANRALHDLLGWPQGTLPGRPATDLLTEGPEGLRDGLQFWRRSDGTSLDVRVRRAGLTLVVEAVDVDAAAHSEANREALAAAGLGEWRWDRATGLLTLSRRAARILGRPPGRSVSWEALKTGLSQAELTRLSALIDDAAGTEEPYQFDTATTVAGRSVILRVRGQAVPGPDGRPASMVGVIQDITTRVEARDEILSRDQRLRVATTVAKLGIFEWHMLEDQAIWENEHMYEIFGHTPEDGTIGKTEFLNDILHPEDRPAVRRAISKALREDGDLHISGRIRRKSDGVWRTIDMAGRFERDAPGRLPRRLIGVVADVTDRRVAEERQSLLIRELHHRVKNTLATVQAIVGSTARTASSIESFYEAFVGRIKSLAHTHSVLTEDTWQMASLANLLRNELKPYAEVAPDGGAEGRISLDGPAIDLPSEIAVPIGMAIHELTTNAAKYGALSNRTGRVAVEWSLEPGGPAGILRFSWRETGGPPVSPPSRQGFGSRLLQRVLITQVQAEVTTDYAPGGFALTMRAPIPPRNDSLNPLV